ncbi:MAG: hypothetical protein ICV60_04215 [Pyrinomonadaceae bacterium]|nr:hypothetical protein [Pyrinomonadaceae bacterium]
MTSNFRDLTKTYKELSSLYKNPTRPLSGKAASDQNAGLAALHTKLLRLFDDNKERLVSEAKKPAIYFKVLALLYEMDDYRGLPPSTGDLIREEWNAALSDLTWHTNAAGKPGQTDPMSEIDFTDPVVRSLWKAKVLVGVASVEIRRKSTRLDILREELNVLEAFVEHRLHLPEAKLPSWTMLAFVRAAQARVARQNQEYDEVRDRLPSIIHCLDERAAEIIEKLSVLEKQKTRTKEDEGKIEKLTDDLVFIRQKQTLSSLFNVGLADLQRGFLYSAGYACEAARLQFRLHGQAFHRLYNELIILSIKRARTSTESLEELCGLRNELESDILPRLKPEGEAGNPKLYLYGLRERAVIQSSCGETEEMLGTLDEMEKVGLSSPQWGARINVLRARSCYQSWARLPEEKRDERLLRSALEYSEAAFTYATGLQANVISSQNTKQLLADIERSVSKNLIDTIESLVNYGTVQLFLGNATEAIKSGNAIVELSIDGNPRLLAMGHLVLAEAYVQKELHLEAHRHLVSAKTLESQIDHKYVDDRRRAVERLMPEYLDLTGKTIAEAEEMLLGWFIDRRSSKKSINKIAEDIGKDRKTVTRYLKRLKNPENRNSPFRHLTKLAGKKK